MSAALDALARLDEGVDRPGDKALAEAYDRFLQYARDRYEHARYERERAEWLANQCGGCVEGGTGNACDDHDEEA